jgi:hypothetical protein
MRPILRVEIIPVAEYQTARAAFRARVIADKKKRRVRLGEHLSALFENRDTVHLQIQEMILTESVAAESAIQHEIETYNELIPADGELSLTLYVEVPEKETRDRMLVELAGLEDHVALVVDGESYPARGKREGAVPDRTTAVHYLKIRLSPEAVTSIRSGEARVALVVDHPKQAIHSELSSETVSKLAEDLATST